MTAPSKFEAKDMNPAARILDPTDKRQLLAACRTAVAEFDVAIAELKLGRFGVEEVALMLSADRISTPGAMAWLRENGCAWVFDKRGPP